MSGHGFIDRLLGRHDWAEDSRYYRLWFDVTYYCLVCGKHKASRDDGRRESLDPRVRNAAIAEDRANAERLRAALTPETPDDK